MLETKEELTKRIMEVLTVKEIGQLYDTMKAEVISFGIYRESWEQIMIGAKDMEMKAIDVLEMMVEQYTQNNPRFNK